MERLPKGVYSPELREQAIRLYESEKLTVPELSKRLSIPKGTLKNWITAARAGKLSDVGQNQRPPTEVELELAKVKRELAEVKMERDLLKKCAAYFARTSA
jgi:transposase